MSQDLKPSIHAEYSLVRAILDGDYTPGTRLPGERQLAASLGVTRPTLREAMSRLDRDGWISIQHGKATVVNDFWKQGGLSVLSAMVRCGHTPSADFITWLLEVRLVLAPAYAEAAVARQPESVARFLLGAPAREDDACFAAFDWELHHLLTVAGGNPVYTLIINGFHELYLSMGGLYFQREDHRLLSLDFYCELAACCARADASAAALVTRRTMAAALSLWRDLAPDFPELTS